MNPTILGGGGVIGPGFLNQVPTLLGQKLRMPRKHPCLAENWLDKGSNPILGSLG